MASIRSLVRLLVALAASAFAAAAAAAGSEEPPGRVGRLAEVSGKVWVYDESQGQWVEARRNQPLTEGDRLSSERGARAEVRIGSSELRVDGNTELEFTRLDDDRVVIQLLDGTLALRVRSHEIADETEVRTPEGTFRPERPGHFRIDREDETTYATAWRGSLRFDGRDQQVQVPPGRRAEFYEQRPDRTTVVSWSSTVNDSFSDWVARDEQRGERSASQRYVSPEMTGVEDLDRYGRWERHPDYGMVWTPTHVAVGWAPYRHGRWFWSVRFGWTWVDDAPWGFAPFHYGRWAWWGHRWAWVPGAYVARPVYSPALVAWVGGPHVSFSVSFGGAAVGWVPLAPRDLYVPPFAYTPRYYEWVNRPHHPRPPRNVPTGPIMYGNHGVPNAVTVVPSNALQQRQPVPQAMLRDGEERRSWRPEQFRPEAPVRPVTRVVAVPGGAQPVPVPPAPGRSARDGGDRRGPDVIGSERRPDRRFDSDGDRRGGRDRARDDARDSGQRFDRPADRGPDRHAGRGGASDDRVIDLRRQRTQPVQTPLATPLPAAPQTAAPVAPARPMTPAAPPRPATPEAPARPATPVASPAPAGAETPLRAPPMQDARPEPGRAWSPNAREGHAREPHQVARLAPRPTQLAVPMVAPQQAPRPAAGSGAPRVEYPASREPRREGRDDRRAAPESRNVRRERQNAA